MRRNKMNQMLLVNKQPNVNQSHLKSEAKEQNKQLFVSLFLEFLAMFSSFSISLETKLILTQILHSRMQKIILLIIGALLCFNNTGLAQNLGTNSVNHNSIIRNRYFSPILYLFILITHLTDFHLNQGTQYMLDCVSLILNI